MFTDVEHKFVVHEHIFKVREHKFTAREYKIYRREKKKEVQIHRLHLYLNMIREFYFTSSKIIRIDNQLDTATCRKYIPNF